MQSKARPVLWNSVTLNLTCYAVTNPRNKILFGKDLTGKVLAFMTPKVGITEGFLQDITPARDSGNFNALAIKAVRTNYHIIPSK